MNIEGEHRVDSFHVNIGVGDCTIHVHSFVQFDSLTDPPVITSRERRRVVLIDAGYPYVELEEQNLDEGDDAPGSKPKKGGFVFSGMAWNLQYTLETIKNYYTVPAHEDPHNVRFDAIVVTHWDADHFTGIFALLNKYLDSVPQLRLDTERSSYRPNIFKYDDNRDPLTTLYMPVWPPFSANHASPFQTLYKQDAFADVLKYHFIMDDGAGDVWFHCMIERMLRFRCKEEQLLGGDFFSSTPLTSNFRTVNNLKELIKLNPPKESEPAMYCIAARQQVMGEANPFPIVDKQENYKNMTSIALIIVWNKSGTPQVSHYFAGDLDDAAERRIAKWIGTNVTTMKASHHGSRTSTPMELLIQFCPRSIIFSAGNKYGHPRWELIVILWYLTKGPSWGMQAGRKPLYCTQYPYYLAKEPSGLSTIYKPDTRLKIDELVGTEYLQKLKEALVYAQGTYPWMDRSFHDMFVDWVEAQPTKPDIAAAYQWLMKQVDFCWSQLSHIGPDTSDAAGAGVWNEGDYAFNQIMYLRAESCATTDDGGVYIRYTNSFREYTRDGPSHEPNAIGIRPPPDPHPLFSLLMLDRSERTPNLSLLRSDVPPVQAINTSLVATTSTAVASSSWQLTVDYSLPAQLTQSDVRLVIQEFKSPPTLTDRFSTKGLTLVGESFGMPPPLDPDEMGEYGLGSKQLDLSKLPPPEISISDVSLPQLGGDGTYLLSQRLKAQKEGVKSTRLEVGVINDFVGAINCGAIALQKSPSNSRSVDILEQDEVFSWMKVVVEATGMKVLYDEHGALEGFSLDTASGLSFSSSANSSSFKLESMAMPPLPRPVGSTPSKTSLSAGFLPSENALVLGLSSKDIKHGSSASETLTLKAVLDICKVPFPSKSNLVTVLGWIPVELDVGGLNTSFGSRNAIWFHPETAYTTTWRLQLSSKKGDVQTINDMLKLLKNFEILGLTYIVRKTASLCKNQGKLVAVKEGSLTAILDFSIKIPSTTDSFPFKTILEMDSSTIKLIIQIDKIGFFENALLWVASSLGQDGTSFRSFEDWLSKGKDAGTHDEIPDIRRVTLVFSTDASGKAKSVVSVKLDLQMSLNVGKDSDNVKPALLFTYEWSKVGSSTLTGSLWCTPPDPFTGPARILRSTWEECNELQVIPKRDQQQYLDIRNLLPSGASLDYIPEGIPTRINQASVEISSVGLSVKGRLVGGPIPSGNVPKLYLGEISLAAAYSWKSKKASFQLGIEAGLIPKDGAAKAVTARLTGLLRYADKVWTLSAKATDIYVANLYSFFDPSSQSEAVAVMENLSIPNISLLYHYSRSGSTAVASSFMFNGTIVLGDFALDLVFKYNMDNVKGWSFTADLGSQDEGPENTTVGAIAQSIAGDQTLELPSFLAEIQVPRPKKDKRLIGLACSKHNEEGVCFFAYVRIMALLACFIQYKRFKSDSDTEEWNTKRIIKASVTELPTMTVPLIGDLSQPFDEMFFLWVEEVTPKKANVKDTNEGTDQDKDKSANTSKGVILAELEAINARIVQANTDAGHTLADPILYKPTKKTHEKTDVVLKSGWHFMVSLKDEKGDPKVVIDYVFGDSHTEKGQKDSSGEETGRGSNDNEESSGSGKKDSKVVSNVKGDQQLAPLSKKSGPITVDNIGFKYKNDTLSIILDAKFLLGPISLDLLGFGLNISFAKRQDTSGGKKGLIPTLLDIGIDDVSVSLDGMGVAFDKPPMTITGMYLHVKKEHLEYFAGGVIIGFQPWLFMAAGFYGKTAPDLPPGTPKEEIERQTFESVFIFLKLDGPLIEFGFANVSGITGGFGYNVDLRYPNVSEVVDFPFVASGKTAGGPLDTLKKLTAPGKGGWINPSRGSMWLAAGLKVDAFHVLSVDAVIVVQWAPAIKIGIFGVAVCDVPNQKASVKFAHIELGIMAVVDPAAGVLRIEAQLSPNSYVLDPNCHLTGGFALYRWWKPTTPHTQGHESQHSDDDWVFTVGGYHPLFKVPVHYPRPDRLKISWKLGDTLSITGEAYFAITPKMCMGGGHLNASLNIGALSAWFDVFLDFLINYEPFYFQADGGLSVGVRYTMDLWLVTLRINVELHAMIHVEGPPMHGYVHVDFWVFGFDIEFGTQRPRPDRLQLPAFYDLVLKTAKASGAVGAEGRQRLHVFACVSGLIPSESQESPSAEAIWKVRGADVSFSVTSPFALSEIHFDFQGIKQDIPQNQNPAVYGKPLQAPNALKSSLTVTVIRKTTPSGDPGKFTDKWKVEAIQKPGPQGLWSEYDSKADPTNKSTDIRSLLEHSDVSKPLTMGVQLTPPPPHRSTDKLTKFNPSKGVILRVEPEDTSEEKSFLFPKPGISSESWKAAKQDEDIQTQYDNVKGAWQKVGDDVQKTIDAWTTAMNWAVLNPDPVALSGAPPQVLLKKFDDLYVRAPCLVV